MKKPWDQKGRGTMEGGKRKHSLLMEGQAFPGPICPLVLSELWSEDKEGPWHTRISTPYPSGSLVSQLLNKTLFQVWDQAAGSRMIDTWEQSARSPGKLHKPPLLALLGPRTLKGAGRPDHIQWGRQPLPSCTHPQLSLSGWQLNENQNLNTCT